MAKPRRVRGFFICACQAKGSERVGTGNGSTWNNRDLYSKSKRMR